MLISSLPGANPLPFEHKIEVFVLFRPPEPTFSGVSSTKSAFLCQNWQFSPGFGPSRAQNRHFCALLPASFFPTAPPASNKPHPAEKSTPVWLAIWRTWAGFANSQLRRAAFRCTYSYICTHPRYCRLEPLLRHSKSFGPSAPIAYATSVSPPDEAVAWPWTQVLDVR